MKRRYLLWVLIPLLIGLGTYVVRSGELPRRWAMLNQSKPVIEFPASLDLGERERGELVVARFAVANRGGQELVIDGIRSNCACSGLEREEGGDFVHVESLRLRPGDGAELAMRIAVSGPSGGPMRNVVVFRTNDPTCPEAAIEVVVSRVTGGISSLPTGVVFGTVPVGDEARQVLKIYDAAVRPRTVERVTSTSPDRIDVCFLPLDVGSPGTREGLLGVLIGRVEVVLRTREPGSVDGQIQVHIADETRRPDTIPVSGRVVGVIDVSPPSLVLPRNSDGGPVYSGRCLCRSSRGGQWTLTVDEVSSGLSAEIAAAEEDAGVRVLRVEWRPDQRLPRPEQTQKNVRLRARVGDQDLLLDVPVICRERGP